MAAHGDGSSTVLVIDLSKPPFSLVEPTSGGPSKAALSSTTATIGSTSFYASCVYDPVGFTLTITFSRMGSGLSAPGNGSVGGLQVEFFYQSL